MSPPPSDDFRDAASGDSDAGPDIDEEVQKTVAADDLLNRMKAASDFDVEQNSQFRNVDYNEALEQLGLDPLKKRWQEQAQPNETAADARKRLKKLLVQWDKDMEAMADIQADDTLSDEERVRRKNALRNQWALDDDEEEEGVTASVGGHHADSVQDDDENHEDEENDRDGDVPGAYVHPLLDQSCNSRYRFSRGIRIGPGLYLKDGVINIHTKTLSDRQCHIILTHAQMFGWDQLHMMAEQKARFSGKTLGYQGHPGMHMQFQQYVLKYSSPKQRGPKASLVQNYKFSMGAAFDSVPLEAMPRSFQQKMAARSAGAAARNAGPGARGDDDWRAAFAASANGAGGGSSSAHDAAEKSAAGPQQCGPWTARPQPNAGSAPHASI